MGGKCKICSNDGLAHLTFHHLYPEKKLKNLDVNTFKRNNQFLINEVSGCVILCANCHSETEAGMHKEKEDEWKRLAPDFVFEVESILKRLPKKIPKHIYYCIDCEVPLSGEANRCPRCDKINQRRVERPSYEQLLQEMEDTNYSAVGRKYGVSDTAIRKWVKAYKKELNHD